MRRISLHLIVLVTALGIVGGILIWSNTALRHVLALVPVQGPSPTFADDFNDNSLDGTKWDANSLFSGFTDTGLPLAETNQRLEIGPLLQNTSGSHYRGVRSINSYNFTGCYSYVELVQAAPSSTQADAMFTIGNSVDAYYRLYVSAGMLRGLRKVGATKTTLFTLSYDPANHRFLRIRHDANTGNVTLDTAPGSGGVPGSWTQQYSEPWSASIALTGTIFEVKGGTSQAEANAPGKVIFDNFQFGSNSVLANPPAVTAISPNSGSANGGNSVTITGTGFSEGASVTIGGVRATNATVVNSNYITATTPAHAAGAVSVVVTNPDAQSSTLNNGFTYNGSASAGTVLLAEDFNDNSLDGSKWDANNLFSGFTDTGLPIAETNQRLEIGPLLQNTSGSHYRGVRSINSYNFTGCYSYVELVQAAPSSTQADAMFTIGNSVDAYYRLYVSAGMLRGLRKVGATKTPLFTLSYDPANHRFLRIRHDANTGNMTLDTAPGNAGVPGTWTQQYSEPWNTSISLTGVIFEVKGGTSQAEANAPGKVIFDNFKAASFASQANQTPLANLGGPYVARASTSVQFNGSASFDPEGALADYQWDFGDGSSGSGPAPDHSYAVSGTYVVTLRVTDNAGLSSTGSTTVTIYPAANQLPVAYIAGPSSAVTGAATQFNAAGSFDPDGSIAQYKWDFAGLGTGSGPTPSFTFTNTGTHLVSLTVTDNLGARSSTSINVTVSAPPGGDQLGAGDSTVSDWDALNRRSLDDPRNDRGNPANKATGNNNFQIVAPVLSLPGRGIDLNLNLVYNSLVWNQSGNDMYFDIDHDSPAPGWHLGFGKMVNMGTAGCMLIEPDGSRHGFKGTVFSFHYNSIRSLPAVDIPVFKGETTDGSMIEYRCETSSWQNPSGVARYPNGTVVYYTNLSSGSAARNYLYPTNIVDKNGNSISILYTWPDAEPRIQRIVDSVGRVIDFRYDAQKRLTSITGPGLKDPSGSPTTRTFVRLHYTTLSLGLTGAFSGITHVRNSAPFVLDAIYYPATSTGYFFGPGAYSSYGMLVKVTQQRGMSFTSAASIDEQGTITEGTVTRVQTYDYKTSPANLTAAPVFNNITETWDGGVAATTTNFAVEENATTSERTVTVTNPDNTQTVQIAFSLNSLPDSDPNKFRNGLTKEERRLDSNGVVIQKTVFTWEQGPNGAPRLQRTETTDERGQVLTTVYDQYAENNGVGRTKELDYAGSVFRTTANTFLSYLDGDLDQGIDSSRGIRVLIHPRLVNLVASTKIFQGDDSANVLAAYSEFKYDEYAETLKSYPNDAASSLDLLFSGASQQPGGITGIVQHVSAFDPSPAGGINGGAGANYFTKRGNVTSSTRYADTSNAAAPASPIEEKMKYDMAGNVISSSKLCCEELSSNFDKLATQYAFAASQTRGSADPNSLLRVTTSTDYDLGTGLPLSVTNANGRLTQTNYFPGSLRVKEIISATGAVTSLDYDDVGMKVVQTTRLSAAGAIATQRTQYLNGLGQVKKEEALGANGVVDIVETVYDQVGRRSKQSLPYRSGQTPQWKETVYDPAGRVAEQREPAVPGIFGTGVSPYPATKYFYNESARPLGASNDPGQTTRTVDAWERSRWIRLDAAGRLAEVIEPNPAGGNGFQTRYSYNALDKLVRSEQGDPQQGVQVRRFRYDSLGRLTQQKLAETEATLNLMGQWSTAGTADDRWSDVFVYDNRSNLISKTDARGVKTIFKYTDGNNVDDPLNRLQSVSYDLSGVPASVTVLPAPAVTYLYRTKASVSTLIDVTQMKQIVAAGVSTEDYDYDTEGRVQEKRLTFAGRTQPMSITYGYDALNRLSQTTYPQQYHDNISTPLRKSVVPAYDAASRVTGLKVNNADYASLVTYNAASQITSLVVGSGANQLTETYTYEDRTNLLSTQSVTRGTTTLMSYSYEYARGYCDMPGAICLSDPSYNFHTGQLTKVTNNGPVGEWKNQKFYYDELGRLTGAEQFTWVHFPKPPDPTGMEWYQRVYWSQNYTYDRFGNRTSVAASNTTGAPLTSDGLQSLSFDSGSNRITSSGFSYDPAGNQLQNNSGQSFVYDAAGRLVKVKNQSGTTLATYTYGASNQRLITQTGSESSTDKTYYIWEGNSVIAEYAEQTSATMPKWSRNYIYLGGRLLATEDPNGTGEIVHYHHPDRLGTKLVTNNLDTTSFYQANLPFGTALDSESTSGITSVTNRRFTSYDRSATTGLDYAVNRQYDSRQGRFTQPDPLGMAAASLADPQSLNMYSYVGNDPVNRIDSDGQFWGLLFKFIVGLFKSLKPNVINGSFTYHNMPPISVSFTPNFQNIGVGFAGIGFDLRSAGHWLPDILGSTESMDPTTGEYLGRPYPPIYCRPDVIEAMKRAWRRTGNGTLGTEAGFVTNGTPGSYTIVDTRSGNTQGYQQITITRALPGVANPTFALFHVHPGSSRWPSTPDNNKLGNNEGDTGIADKFNIQFYVISRSGLSLYDPRTKNEPNKGMTMVRNNLDWTKPCE